MKSRYSFDVRLIASISLTPAPSAINDVSFTKFLNQSKYSEVAFLVKFFCEIAFILAFV